MLHDYRTDYWNIDAECQKLRERLEKKNQQLDEMLSFYPEGLYDFLMNYKEPAWMENCHDCHKYFLGDVILEVTKTSMIAYLKKIEPYHDAEWLEEETADLLYCRDVLAELKKKIPSIRKCLQKNEKLSIGKFLYFYKTVFFNRSKFEYFVKARLEDRRTALAAYSKLLNGLEERRRKAKELLGQLYMFDVEFGGEC